MPFDGTSYITEATKLLMDGRERIRAGWCQGMGRTYGGVCMLFALDLTHPAAEEAEVLLKRSTGASDIPTWNDASGRTKDDAMIAYDCAIDLSMNFSATAQVHIN